MRDTFQQLVLREHAGRNSIGVMDDASDLKRGDKTPGVQRQWCGTVGKQENRMLTVHPRYATSDLHCLVDGERFLPEGRLEDRARCRAAGLPDNVV